MSRHLTQEQAIAQAEIVAPPQPAQALLPLQVDRSFELPKALYLATVGLYLAFVAVLMAGMQSRGLVVPAAIIAIIIVAGFKVPAIWTQMKPDSGQEQLSWSRFRQQGIRTLTGRLSAGEATAQVLVLPVLILLWGIAVVTIRAFVMG